MLSRIDFLNTLIEKAKNDPTLFRHVRLTDSVPEEYFRGLKNFLMADLAAGTELTTLPCIDAMFNDKSRYNLTYEDVAYLEDHNKGRVSDCLSMDVLAYFMDGDFFPDDIVLYSKTTLDKSLSASVLKTLIKNPNDFSDFMLENFIENVFELQRGLKNSIQIKMSELCAPYALHIACMSAKKYEDVGIDDPMSCFINSELLIEKDRINGLRCFLVNSKMLLEALDNKEPLDEIEFNDAVSVNYVAWFLSEQCDSHDDDGNLTEDGILMESLFLEAKNQGKTFGFINLHPNTKDPLKALYPSEIKDKYESGEVILLPWQIDKFDTILAIEKEVDDFLASNA